MATEQCDGCGAEVRIAGGIGGIWSSKREPTGGMTLEFDDGTEFFLCFECIEALPDDPTASDVDVLE